jgi:hypothetical protein
VNNRRTGEPVILFPTKRQFIDYTWPDRTYSLREAVFNKLMTSLLRPVSQAKYQKTADREFKGYMSGKATRNGGHDSLDIYD